MKRLVLGALCASLLFAHPASARDHKTIHLGSVPREPAYWTHRYGAAERTFAITTQSDGVTLLLTPDDLALQLSDFKMHRFDREARRERAKEDDSPIGDAIKSVVLDAVGRFLDHSVTCPIRDVRDVVYQNGALRVITSRGDDLFAGIEVDDEGVAEGFASRDAQEFVRQFHRLKRGAP